MNGIGKTPAHLSQFMFLVFTVLFEITERNGGKLLSLGGVWPHLYVCIRLIGVFWSLVYFFIYLKGRGGLRREKHTCTHAHSHMHTHTHTRTQSIFHLLGQVVSRRQELCSGPAHEWQRPAIELSANLQSAYQQEASSEAEAGWNTIMPSGGLKHPPPESLFSFLIPTDKFTSIIANANNVSIKIRYYPK